MDYKHTAKILHGNDAKITSNNIEPIYKTLTVVGKNESSTNSTNPVNPVSDEDVIIAKKAVDDNHK